MERIIERLLYSARWLLAPIYLGMVMILLALLIEFFQSASYLLWNVDVMEEMDLTLKALALIDVALVAGLIVMVMYSGYENFVSKLDIGEGTEKLSWLGKMDTGSLKAKVAASIVAISSIQLLKVFMSTQSIPNDKLMWYLLFHLTFVASAFFMGMLDYHTRRKSSGDGDEVKEH